MPEARASAAPDDIDRRIINALQGDFPLVDEPYRAVAGSLGLDEAELLRRIDAMLERRVLTRFGPMFQIERAGGAFVLAAMKVPEHEFEGVAAKVNAFPEVAHNYRRDHSLNMWFVLATATPQGITEAVTAIESATGLAVLPFPKEREYFVEMKLHA
ncbi:MAG: AsnC family transcriptional regulator [Rhodocyclales bacterium]|nr:AsnC family transcriptional regulator [Rhodocyclales bacterium]